MKFLRQPVGELSKIGFSKFLKQVEEQGDIIVLYRFNEPTVLMMPCDRVLETSMELSLGMTNFADTLKNDGTPPALINVFLRSIIECASVARLMLGQEITAKVERDILDLYRERINNHKEEASSAGEQLVAPYDEEEGMPVVSPNLLKPKNKQTSSSKRKTPPRSGVRKKKEG